MRQGWSDYERSAERGPLHISLKVFFGLLLFSMVAGTVLWGIGWFAETASVVREEFGPRELLRKYTWFKDSAAMLDKKRADIAVYRGRMQAMDAAYADLPRPRWDRVDKQQYNQWVAELAGVTASYNTLAAKYNSKMAQFHWRFMEAGALPPGATDPLPREYKPYHQGGLL